MASHIKKGESLLIPFRNGQSISDSQLKPRMYKTMQAFEKSFPEHYLGTDGVELVEYAPVVRCKDCRFWLPEEPERCKAMKEEPYGLCNRYPQWTDWRDTKYHDDFCSCGERRTNNE